VAQPIDEHPRAFGFEVARFQSVRDEADKLRLRGSGGVVGGFFHCLRFYPESYKSHATIFSKA
jgi:hypothetical protein